MRFIKFVPWFTVLTVVQCGYITKIGAPQPIWNSTFTDQLRKDLLLEYDKFSRPAEHFDKTNVSFGMNIRHIDVDEAKSILTVNCWLRLVWFDQKLRWNPDDYGGVRSLNVAEHEVWQPDIQLLNSGASSSVNQYGGSHCIVYFNGEVLWIPPAVFTTLCNFNLKYWPFDTQECYMKFSSWTYNGDQIGIRNYGNSTVVETEKVVNNGEWTITKASQEILETFRPSSNESYPDVTVNITISRISPAYKSLVITPAIAIIFMTLMIYWLPPQAGEKIILNASTSLIISLFIFYLMQKLPATGEHTPLIVLFYSSCFYVTIFSTISSVIVITISRMKHKNALPWAIKYPLTGKIGKMCLLSSYIRQSSIMYRDTAEEMVDHQVTDCDEDTTSDGQNITKQGVLLCRMSHQQDWLLLAAAIDRISFIFYSFLFSILIIMYVV